jgi:hypothetical protein
MDKYWVVTWDRDREAFLNSEDEAIKYAKEHLPVDGIAYLGEDVLFEDFTGKTLVKVDGAIPESKEIRFVTDSGATYTMRHEQECCEEVMVEDVAGDIADLIGTPILMAAESSDNTAKPAEMHSSATWTFYRMSTIKGTVVIRWYGSSSGYYSESARLFRKQPGE